MAALFRHPTATEAYELGFAPGIREDYSFQIDDLPNVDLPVVMLDNNFHEPDLDRYLERFEEYDPSVAVLGDAYDTGQAEELSRIGEQILKEHPHKEIIVVPKTREAFDTVSDSLTHGYAMGYSGRTADDFTDYSDWRGKRAHLLGSSPPKQYNVIQKLTQPNLSGDPPADIAGLDWNGFTKPAYRGEYWSRNGWQPADHLSIRETVRKSLQEIKNFWQDKNVWPETEPIELHGPAVERPIDEIYAVTGEHILTREELENCIVREYPEYGKLAFRNETEKNFLEYRSGLITEFPEKP